HEAIPRGEDLLVTHRLDAVLSGLEQPSSRVCEEPADLRRLLAKHLRRLFLRERHVKNVVVLEVADVRDVVNATEDLADFFAEQAHDLGPLPYEELSFDALAVGVLRRVEAAFG